MELRNAQRALPHQRPAIFYISPLAEEVANLKAERDRLRLRLDETLAKLNEERAARLRAEEAARTAFSPDLATVTYAVCQVWGCTRGDLVSAARRATLVTPRHAAFWLARTHTHLKLTEIAQWFKRDYSSVSHGVRVAQRRIRTSPLFATKIAQAESLLSGRANG
jgi:chromosomal replication initiation ATPase DnaA